MRSSTVIALAACALLGACATTPPPGPVVLCDTAGAAPAEPEPTAPVLTDAQRLAVDVAVVSTLGPVLGAALIRYSDVEHPAWGRRAAARVTATAEWCASLAAVIPSPH